MLARRADDAYPLRYSEEALATPAAIGAREVTPNFGSRTLAGWGEQADLLAAVTARGCNRWCQPLPMKEIGLITPSG
ncbi:hypothetical protein Pla86_44070 [Planctomycetes bacterium Pla86]|uniref:Uncharacterized protein n=1 Tax=Engelhardtia mirabilis TaxID=2528011 RepID=A0A518BQS0_9BACT|nr:hypothetical protein Pla133_44090 [Planctomycetes bacterium Pla133]QDV03616.1 hypothetical protein Pla86_44070 [Planctomycetes bacterium Pla86]